MTFDEWWEAANYSSEDAWVKDVAQAAWKAGARQVFGAIQEDERAANEPQRPPERRRES